MKLFVNSLLLMGAIGYNALFIVALKEPKVIPSTIARINVPKRKIITE